MYSRFLSVVSGRTKRERERERERGKKKRSPFGERLTLPMRAML